MIIDKILDRKDGFGYDAKDFYTETLDYENTFDMGHAITIAMDYGTEDDAREALCDYILRNNYNKDICEYINSIDWIESD